MLDQVQAYIRARAIINKDNAHLLVALSGGADSVCLLHLLSDMGYRLTAAHCNFHLRGAESDRDEQFVRDLCSKLEIPLHVRSFQTRDYAEQHHLSIEMAARELRYEWFEQLRAQTGADYIAVAHHLNDQAETLLQHLRRGTGIRGLEGMKPVNGRIIRPLLCVTRAQIEAYAESKGYAYITDSTNADTSIQRNAIRRILSTSTEAELRHMAHTADLMQQYDLLLEALLHGTPIPQECEHTLLYELLAPYGFNAAQTEQMLAALPGSGKRFETPHFTAVIDHGKLRIQSAAEVAPDNTPLVIRAVRMRFEHEHYPPTDAPLALFDADRLPAQLMLRHWQEGDSFVPLANKRKPVRRKVQDFFSDEKIAVADKSKIWLLCNEEQPAEIIWIVGHRISDPYKITDATRSVAEIEIEI